MRTLILCTLVWPLLSHQENWEDSRSQLSWNKFKVLQDESLLKISIRFYALFNLKPAVNIEMASIKRIHKFQVID